VEAAPSTPAAKGTAVNNVDREAFQEAGVRAAQLSETIVLEWFKHANWTNPGSDGAAHFLRNVRHTAAIRDELLKLPAWPSIESEETAKVANKLLRTIALDIAQAEERLAKYGHVPAWAFSTRKELAGILKLKAIAERVESLHDGRMSYDLAGQANAWQPHARHLSASLDETCQSPYRTGSRARLIRLALAAIGINQTEDAIAKVLSPRRGRRSESLAPVRTQRKAVGNAKSTT
jgi:hypothetical protein